MLITHNGKNLLIDAGTDIRFSLRDVGLSYKDINAIYLTHCHSDHVGGFEYLAFTTYFDPSCTEKIQLFGNSKLLRLAWNNSLKGGLESVQVKVLNLNDYFDVCMIPDNGSFIWQDIKFRIVQSVHIMNGFCIVPTYGLMIEYKGKTIYYTGDVQCNPNQIKDFYDKSDLIIQDCETAYKSGVHAHYSELTELNEKIRNKMYLVHFQDNILDKEGHLLEEWKEKAKNNGFLGFVSKWQELELRIEE